jgi:hypothetical protein
MRRALRTPSVAAMRRVAAAVAVLAALAVAACGESAADKAQNTVCDSRDDISKQVNELKDVTPATLGSDEVTNSLKAIRSDLSNIAGAQGDLSDERRQQVEDANKEFTSSVESVVKEIGTSATAKDAASSVSAAAQQLASSYKQAFSRVDCD